MDNEQPTEDVQPTSGYDALFVRNMVESFLRIGLIIILLMISYDIIKPFTMPILWGAIIAMAAFPLVKWLEPKIGGKRGLASSLVCLSFILILVIPTYSLTDAVLGGMKNLAVQLDEGTLHVPPPNEKVKDWPVIGERTHAAWSAANADLEAFAKANADQIKEMSGKVLKRVGSSLMGVLMFVISIIIAGVFMAFAESCGKAAHRFFVRVGGLRPGGEWATMSVATVRSVLQGVVGVAVIQTILITIGLFAAGVPGAPILSAIVLVVCIAQIPALLVLLPIIAYVFSAADTTTAIIFAVYQFVAAASDNVLKPMLMGRGLDIPMPVILLGAIGGMVMSGIIGLFVGAVVLSIWYKLFMLWIEQQGE